MGGRADVDVAVPGGQGLIGSGNPVGGTQGAGNVALGKVEGGFPDGVGNAGFEQRGVDDLPLAGFEGVDAGAKDAIGGQGAGGDVGDRDADFGRGAVGKAGNAHQSAHTLGDEVEAAALGVGAGRAKAGYGAIDQAGLELGQLFIA